MPLSPNYRYHLFLYLALFLALLPTTTSVAADPDLWWHLRLGLDQLEAGRFIFVDRYSYGPTADRWVNHEWLAQILLALSYQAGGEAGLLWLRNLLLLAAAAAALGLFLVNYPRSPLPLLGMILLLGFYALLLSCRPHGFTYLLTPLFLLVFTSVQQDGRWQRLWLLPFLMILWVNLHGGFILGLGISGLYLAQLAWQPAVRSNSRRLIFLGGIGLLLFAATLINPYGPALYSYLWVELSASHEYITEWQPLSSEQWPFFVMLTAPPLLLALILRKIPDKAALVLLLICAVSTIRHVRFVLLAGICGILVMLQLWHSLRVKEDSRWQIYGKLLAQPLVPLFLAIAIGLFTIPATMQLTTADQVPLRVSESLYPIAAVQMLKENTVGRRIALPIHWGGYVIWHLGEHYQVALDGRNVTFYAADYLDQVLAAWHSGVLADFIAGLPTDILLLPTDSRLAEAALVNPDWELFYRDEVAAIFRPGPHTSATPGE